MSSCLCQATPTQAGPVTAKRARFVSPADLIREFQPFGLLRVHMEDRGVNAFLEFPDAESRRLFDLLLEEKSCDLGTPSCSRRLNGYCMRLCDSIPSGPPGAPLGAPLGAPCLVPRSMLSSLLGSLLSSLPSSVLCSTVSLCSAQSSVGSFLYHLPAQCYALHTV